MKFLKACVKYTAIFLAVVYGGLIAYAYWPTGIEEVPATELAGPDDRFIAVDNLQLRYRTFGTPGAGKPNLVLIHGFGNSLQSFRLLAPLLADDFYVVTVDLPGFGLSSKPVDYEYYAANQSATIGKFIRALGVEKGLETAVIGGHSLGGQLALRVAVTEPEINGLLLLNPGIISTGVPAITEYLPWPFQRLSAKQFGDRDFRESFLKTSFVDPSIVTDAMMDDLQLATRSEGYMAGSTAMMNYYEAATEEALLPEVTVPTVIGWGQQDKNKSPAELQQLRDGLQGEIVVEVADAGHYVHEEGAEEVAAFLIANKGIWQ
jgi:pimeloyl-ACP methyl ester carboxylesterase